jgi:uncharacterized protein YukE
MDGFEYDAASVRGFAEVFNQAKAQVDQVRATVGQTTAHAADFGKSWQDHGAKFEAYMKAIADDLGNLATHLGEIHANLMQGTDLVVQADSTGFQNIKAIEEQLPAQQTASHGGGNRAV